MLVPTGPERVVSLPYLLEPGVSQNYHWQWVSFLSAASTAGYVFLYSGYYLWFKTHQSGFMQISFYFGYM